MNQPGTRLVFRVTAPAVDVNEGTRPMKSRIAVGIAVASIAVLGLTACSSDTPGTPGGAYGGGATTPAESTTPGTSTSAEPSVTPAATGASLVAADSSLGSIVVDGDGNVLYQFDSDTQGGDSSSCAGPCLANWPPVHGTADAVTLDGVTGTVSSITGTDGESQLTLNGWPLYYFAGDANPGDTNGQAVNDVWWVVTPAGEPVRG